MTEDEIRKLKEELLMGVIPGRDSRLVIAEALQELLELRSQLRDLRSQTLREARTVFNKIEDLDGWTSTLSNGPEEASNG